MTEARRDPTATSSQRSPTRAPTTWFTRPLHRDRALWAGLVLGVVTEVLTSRTRAVGLLSETPFFLLHGVVLVGLVVGAVRHLRYGLAEGASAEGPGPIARRYLRARRAVVRR